MMPTSEQLQLVILSALDKAPIPDTRELLLSLPEGVEGAKSLSGEKVGSGAEEQLAVKGALDSLAGREVGFSS